MIGQLGFRSTIAVCLYVLQALTVQPARTSCRPMMALTSGALKIGARALGTCVLSCAGRSARLFFMSLPQKRVGLPGQPTPTSPSREPSPHRSGSPTDALVSVAGRKRKIFTWTQMKQKPQKQKLEWLCSIRLICRDPKTMNYRHAKASSDVTDSSLLAPTNNHF
jgi:hypothetical protein